MRPVVAPGSGVGQRGWVRLDCRCEELGLSQPAFASAYHIPLATLKGWEQGRRQPDATASAYLSVIAKLPDQAHDVLQAA